MKVLNKVITTLLLFGATLGFSSCDKYEYEEPQKSFAVLKTEYNASALASEGTIVVNQEGFKLRVDEDWLTTELVNPKTIKLKLEQNKGFDSRTANVILKKNEEVVKIPITQFGSVNTIDKFSDVTIGRKGGKQEFAIQAVDEVKLIVSPLKAGEPIDWLVYEVKDGKLILTADKLPNGLSKRAVRVTATTGLFSKTITVTQNWGSPDYADVLGTYVLDYVAEFGKPKVQAEVNIVPLKGKEGQLFVLLGLVRPILLIWNADDSSITIPLGEQPKPDDLADGLQLMLSASGNGYEDANGKKNLGLRVDKEFFFKGIWATNTTAKNLMFTFPPVGSKEPKFHGLHFWKFDGNNYKGEYAGKDGKGIHTLSDFTLTKKL